MITEDMRLVDVTLHQLATLFKDLLKNELSQNTDVAKIVEPKETVRGIDNLSERLGVSPGSIRSWMKRGIIDGCYSRPSSRTYIFNVGDVLRATKYEFKRKPRAGEEIMATKTKKKPNLMLKLDIEFSKFIRGRDSKNGYFKCISCGKIKPYAQADCGHYINRRHMSTRFDEMNCNAQCRFCNRFDEGNIQGYRKGLIAKYGEQAVKLLELKKYQKRFYSDFEYDALIKYYKSKIKEL